MRPGKEKLRDLDFKMNQWKAGGFVPHKGYHKGGITNMAGKICWAQMQSKTLKGYMEIFYSSI